MDLLLRPSLLAH